jgi:ferredoxin
MSDGVIHLGQQKKSTFMDKVKEILPEGGNLNLCLTCGACSSGCPATGLDGMDPRKFLRMAALGMDEEIAKSNWPWMCSMCQRCIYVCPMKIDIPQLVYQARKLRPREERPSGILGSCDMALRNASTSAMGTSPEDFEFVVGGCPGRVPGSPAGICRNAGPHRQGGGRIFPEPELQGTGHRTG